MFLTLWAAPGSLRPRAGLGPSARVMEGCREGQMDSRCLGQERLVPKRGWMELPNGCGSLEIILEFISSASLSFDCGHSHL